MLYLLLLFAFHILFIFYFLFFSLQLCPSWADDHCALCWPLGCVCCLCRTQSAFYFLWILLSQFADWTKRIKRVPILAARGKGKCFFGKLFSKAAQHTNWITHISPQILFGFYLDRKWSANLTADLCLILLFSTIHDRQRQQHQQQMWMNAANKCWIAEAMDEEFGN